MKVLILISLIPIVLAQSVVEKQDAFRLQECLGRLPRYEYWCTKMDDLPNRDTKLKIAKSCRQFLRQCQLLLTGKEGNYLGERRHLYEQYPAWEVAGQHPKVRFDVRDCVRQCSDLDSNCRKKCNCVAKESNMRRFCDANSNPAGVANCERFFTQCRMAWRVPNVAHNAQLDAYGAQVGPKYDHRIVFFRDIFRFKVDWAKGQFQSRDAKELGDLDISFSGNSNNVGFPSLGSIPSLLDGLGITQVVDAANEASESDTTSTFTKR